MRIFNASFRGFLSENIVENYLFAGTLLQQSQFNSTPDLQAPKSAADPPKDTELPDLGKSPDTFTVTYCTSKKS